MLYTGGKDCVLSGYQVTAGAMLKVLMQGGWRQLSLAAKPSRIRAFAYNHPVTIFQATVAALNPASLVSGLLLVPIALIVEWEIIASTYFFKGRRDLEELIEFRKQFEGCEFRKIDVKSALSKEDIERLVFRKHGRHLEHLENEVINRINIYVVTPHESASRPSCLYAMNALGREYIFIGDHPSELKGIGKFYFQHELGHVSILNDFFQLEQIQCSFAHYFLSWLAFQIKLDLFWSVILGFGIFYSVMSMVFRQTLQYFFWHPRLEQFADYFGLSALNTDERKAVSRFYRKYPEKIPYDPKMSKEFNDDRRKFLQSLLLSIDRDERAPLPTPPFPKVWGMWLRGLTMILLAFGARQPQIGSVFVGSILALGNLLGLTWYSFRCHRADKRLSEILGCVDGF